MEEKLLNKIASYIQEAMEKFAKEIGIEYKNAIDYFKEYFEFLKEKESGNNIDNLARSIVIMSAKSSGYVEKGENRVYVYPSRILIFNKQKDGELWFDGTNEELKVLCDKVAEKYIEWFNSNCEIFENQKTTLIQKQMVTSIDTPCKELLLTLEVKKLRRLKGEDYEQMVNNRRKSQRKNRKGRK